MNKNTGDGELEPDELDLILGELQNYMVEVKRTIKAKTAIKKYAAQEANKAYEQGYDDRTLEADHELEDAQRQLLQGLMEQLPMFTKKTPDDSYNTGYDDAITEAEPSNPKQVRRAIVMGELREKVAKIQNRQYDKEITIAEAIKQIMALIASYSRGARIDELENLSFDRQDSWGKYLLPADIEERIKTLKEAKPEGKPNE